MDQYICTKGEPNLERLQLLDLLEEVPRLYTIIKGHEQTAQYNIISENGRITTNRIFVDMSGRIIFDTSSEYDKDYLFNIMPKHIQEQFIYYLDRL